MSFVQAPVTFEVKLLGVWTDITADVLDGFTMKVGVTSGHGPMDCVAGTGTCSFMLRNDLAAGHPIGYYSPNHASCRAGWTFGISFRLSLIGIGASGPTQFFRFFGKIYSILPDSGTRGRRQVAVIAYDIMRDLAEVTLDSVGLQVGMTESQIISNIISSLPAASQPDSISVGVGVDTFPYALDDIGPNSKALSVIADVARSAFAFVYCSRAGQFTVVNRHTRATAAAVGTFSSDFADLQVPSDLSNVYNLVRVTIHPKTIDPAATTVLYALTGTVPTIPPGQTVTFFGSYNDPNNAQRLIGGLDVVTSLVAYPTFDYDYAGNGSIDGTGADLTGLLSIAVTAFAATAKFEVTNLNISFTVFLIQTGGSGPWLRVRGKGVYDLGPQIYQSTSVQSYGTRPIDIDMRYQSDPNVGQAAAQYVLASYQTLANQVQQMTFIANDSNAHMLLALAIEPGDRLTITEPVTGITSIDVIVLSVALTMVEKLMTVTLALTPANTLRFWLWGIVGRSEWGINTVYGF